MRQRAIFSTSLVTISDKFAGENNRNLCISWYFCQFQEIFDGTKRKEVPRAFLRHSISSSRCFRRHRMKHSVPSRRSFGTRSTKVTETMVSGCGNCDWNWWPSVRRWWARYRQLLWCRAETFNKGYLKFHNAAA